MSNSYNRNYFEKRDSLDLLLADSLIDLLKKTNSNKILDVGCGTGRLVKYFSNHGLDAHGVDNSKIALKKARQKNKFKKIILSPATKLPFKNNAFDFLCAISLIEHLSENDSEEFLKEAGRVLKKGGRLFLVTPNFATPIRHLVGPNWFAYQDPTHINFYTPKKLSALLLKIGFKNPTDKFKVNYTPKYDRQFPKPFSKLPRTLKILSLHLLFNSPIAIVRDSFWIYAQK